ncbi:sensor histidine kinase [Lachnoanaerobaculum umeaense]|jgi:sensory box histidine kinase vicK|uniref:histidine kinase n=1 Tax=Lachnoanaerobaculum umeaense TaxID=617123 RepID=A0A385PZ53_9FIRM|nr:HAMP domain-containing sensor histidine kinase [Lachnoanaerobaculum umeaense]AYA98654.1 sensor histidine kinase [Lachnoanaerobaculum umeaense]PZW95762.1 signal transduction histidine kinase [Lachnoanaerobaculum umeaense]
MDEEKKRLKFKLPPINLRIFLTIVFLLFGILPIFIYGRIVSRTNFSSRIDARKIEIQTKGLMLSNKLTRGNFLKNTEDREVLRSEIDTVAEIYNGRIVIIDKSYKTIEDTFNLSLGKINISPEIVDTFGGSNTNIYNKSKSYILQTIPIYESIDNQNIDGVLMFIASTENLVSVAESVGNTEKFLYITLTAIVVVLSVIIANRLLKPLTNLRDDIASIGYGKLDQKIEHNEYQLTKSISENINATLAKLQAADKSRDEFVANVSHELKTPITSIRVLADSLMSMENVPNEMYAEFMQDISDEIDREAKIIDDLLSLVKLDKSATKLVTEQVDINQLIKQILKRLRPIAQKRDIEMTFETIREVNADVDETKLSLAINNLIENAIKYNKDGGYVKVSIDADHKFFYIKVKDSGDGIAPEYQDLIFERFYRIDKARSRQTGGTGLGLAITRNVIHMHDGIIKVSSKEGEGTMFTVRIPLNHVKRRDKK